MTGPWAGAPCVWPRCSSRAPRANRFGRACIARVPRGPGAAAEPVAVDGGETDHVRGVLHPQTGAAEGVAVFISAGRRVRTCGGNGGETDHV